ncbi:MAG: cytochrome c biogenesis protein CcdA [Paracoccaceae bacterium]|jgi:cytochrome c biogenesis protein CcdA
MLSLLFLGFLIGITHAFEADHLAALTSLVSGKTKKTSILRHGAFWGFGHSITLLVVGGIVLATGATVSAQVSLSLELLVGLMLVFLGGHVLFRLYRERAHFHKHGHNDGTTHFHLHSHKDQPQAHDPAHHRHRHPDHAVKRALAVGMMHGAAGSAALVLVAAAAIDTPMLGFFYIVLFGVGSIFGMAAMSLLIAAPLAWTAKVMTQANGVLQIVIGLVTIGVGAGLIWETAHALIA